MGEDNEDPTNKEMRLYAKKDRWHTKQNVNRPIIQNVNVVGLNIPFWDLVTLTIYNGFAVLLGIFIILIIVGFPLLLITFMVGMAGGFWGFLGLILSLGWIILVIWFMSRRKPGMPF